MKRLAIVTTHPIQYNAPLFKLLAERKNIDIKVFYTWGESVLEKKYDPGFGKVIEWDIPLLEGYEYEFLENTAIEMGSHHFKGIINPGAITIIKKYNPDAILVYGWSFQSHLKIMRYFKNKIPVLFRGDSTILDKTGFISNFKRKIFLNWVYRNIDIALFTGSSNFDYFRYAGVTKHKLYFAPHAINNELFRSNDKSIRDESDQFRKQLKIGVGQIVFLFAGKFEHKKNPLLLIQAFIEANLSNAHLVMIGNGVLENEIKNRSDNIDNIHIIAFQNQSIMPAWYQLADVYVLPSQGPGETWGLAINEAMAAGNAIISSDKCGASADLVQENVNGFVFCSEDRQQLKNLLITLAIDKIKLDKMKVASVNIIKDYSLENLAKAIETKVNNA